MKPSMTMLFYLLISDDSCWIPFLYYTCLCNLYPYINPERLVLSRYLCWCRISDRFFRVSRGQYSGHLAARPVFILALVSGAVLNNSLNPIQTKQTLQSAWDRMSVYSPLLIYVYVYKRTFKWKTKWKKWKCKGPSKLKWLTFKVWMLLSAVNCFI